MPSLQRVSGKLAISPDEGDLRLGGRLLALASSLRTVLDYIAVEAAISPPNGGIPSEVEVVSSRKVRASRFSTLSQAYY